MDDRGSRSRFPGELHLALRRWRRTPGHGLSVAVNLAVGIGATTAFFAVLHGVVLRPLPYPEAERLVVIEHELPGFEMGGEPTRFGAFQGQALHYAERSRQLAAVGVFGTYDAVVAGLGEASEAASVRTGYASAGFFRALGSKPAAGRLFADDDEAASPVLLTPAAVVAGRDGAMGEVGAALRVDGADRRIVGVLAASGPFPAGAPRLWIARSAVEIRQTPQLLVDGLVARLTADATPASLERELDALITELPERWDDDFIRRAVSEGRLRSKVTALADHVHGSLAGSLWMLLAAGALVLVAALINVTQLLLLRGEARRQETAVRRALGARRWDLVRQSLAEALILAGTAGVAAVGLAAIGVDRALAAVPLELPRAAEVSIGPVALALALVLTAVCALWMTLVLSLARPAESLGARPASAGSHRSRSRVRTVLAAAELAAAVVLLVIAGLLLRSFAALAQVDPGFEADSVLSFRVPFPFQEIADAGGSGRATPFFDALRSRLSGLSGVTSVGYASCTPLARSCGLEGLTLRRAEAPAEDATSEELFGVLQIGPGYHETLSLPLRSGRYLERRDHEQRTNSMVVSASVARRLWGGDNPLGRRVVSADVPELAPFTVVGVVEDAHHASLDGGPEAVVYLPVLLRGQPWELSTVSFVARTVGAPLALVDEVRGAVRALRPDIPVTEVEPLEAALERATARWRFAALLLAAAAGATLLLAATGVHGVVAYAVSLRRGEFGIRLALGADGQALRRMVYRQGALIVTAGLSGGLAMAFLASRAMQSRLFQVAPADPWTYAAATLLLASATWIACAPPAHRAAGLVPAEVLRRE